MKLQTDIKVSDIKSGDKIHIVELLTNSDTIYNVEYGHATPIGIDPFGVYLEGSYVGELRTFLTMHEEVNNTITVIR
jgi:hypothetical protein